MSLINDALKRAAEAEKRQTGTRRPRRRGPKGAEALGPMIHSKPVKSRRDMLSVSPAFGLIMLIILMGGLSTFLLHNWWNKRRPFKPNIPPGMDPLEAMIKHDPRLTEQRPDGPILVTEQGLKSNAQTNSVATTGTNSVPAPAPELVRNTDTNSVPVPPPPAVTNELPVGPLVAATNSPDTPPQLPLPTPSPTPDGTNSVSGPIRVPEAAPSAKVIVRPRPPEGNKRREQIEAERAAREKEMMMASTQKGVTTSGPARIDRPETTVEFPELAVRAIIIKQNAGSADVNGKIVTIGDVVGGAELVEIRTEYLVFAMKGERRTYYIAQ